MRFAASIIALAAPLFVVAAPWKRQDNELNLLVLKFADVLEQLESKFYSEALAKFKEKDFIDAGFSNAQLAIEQFVTIQADEATHSVALREGIKTFGGQPVDTCSFDFTSVLVDVKTMATVARLVENVGVTAYLGAALLISDAALLAAAGSILTVEARHQTILNVLNAGTAIPQAFDFGFTPNEVLALAGPFISGCDLGIPANPSLTITNTGVVAAGTLLTFSSPAINGSTDGFHCQMLAGGLPCTISLPLSQCIVPEGINGPVALWITSDSQPLINNPRDRARDKQIAGPTIAFLDNKPQILGQLARNPGGAPPAVTTTITPDQATSILSGAQPLPTA